jgi:hypothetical protein
MDPVFDQQLRVAHNDTPDPLAIMRSAARTHWRAAAWLLERENPEDYGRKPARCCTPFQFDEALKTVIEAALRLAPPENRAKVYAYLTDASETAFKAIFPNYSPCGRRLVERLPSTPLVNAEHLNVIRESAHNNRIPDPFDSEDAPAAQAERAVGFTPRSQATQTTPRIKRRNSLTAQRIPLSTKRHPPTPSSIQNPASSTPT